MADKNFEINTAKRMPVLELPLVTILAVFTPTSIDPPSNLALPAHVTHGPTAGKHTALGANERGLPLRLATRHNSAYDTDGQITKTKKGK